MDLNDKLTPTPKTGYSFDKYSWSGVADDGNITDSNAKVTVSFKLNDYKVYVNDVEVANTSVTINDKYTLNKVTDNGFYSSVSAVIGGSAEATTSAVVKYNDGAWTVSYPTGVAGDIYITANHVNASVELVAATDTDDGYVAYPEGKQLAILTATAVNGKMFTIGTKTFYSSVKYGGTESAPVYLMFVDATWTNADVLKAINLTEGTMTAVNYGGDVSMNCVVTSVDAGIINDVLHGFLSDGITDLMRLRMDVTGDKEVTTDDIRWILKTIVGLDTTNAGGVA